jgi:MFS family permease
VKRTVKHSERVLLPGLPCNFLIPWTDWHADTLVKRDQVNGYAFVSIVFDFSLTQTGFGVLSSSFYYPYMLLQVPAGLLVVRFGARRLLIAGISLCTLASFLSAYSREFAWVETARILMGLGAAPTFVCTMALVTRWFPPSLLPILIALDNRNAGNARSRPRAGNSGVWWSSSPAGELAWRCAAGLDC